MRKLKIYLDTSVLNFLFAIDAPDKQADTVEFFGNSVAGGEFEVWISPIVTDEILRTKDTVKRGQLLEVIAQYELKSLSVNDAEIHDLAALYVEAGIIPAKKLEDALHVAIATYHQMDILVSWNFRHLANLSRESRIRQVNLSQGYLHELRLVTPLEVLAS